MKRDINRFLDAQNNWYDIALKEIKNGRKENHWIWFIFPQLRFLGQSFYSDIYGIEDLEEAKRYVNNSTLLNRYIECCNALLSLEELDINLIMGGIDAMKLRSSLTLFYIADENNRELYASLINKYYSGVYDKLTLDYLDYQL